MITNNRLVTRWNGISSDQKPSGQVRNGSKYYEMDTCRLFVYDEENQEWKVLSSPTDVASNKVGIGLVGYMAVA